MANTAQILKTKKATNAFTLIEIMIVVLIIGILLAIAVPNFVRARETSRAKACVANLKTIDGAVQQFAMTHNVQNGSGIGALGLQGLMDEGFLKTLPACPSSGTYAFTTINSSPTCSVGGTVGDSQAHILP